MNIKIYTDTRRANKNGEYPISISVNRDGFRFYVKTGLTTPTRLIGREFPKTVSNYRTKTNALNAIVLKVEEYCLAHQFEPDEVLKTGLLSSISGKQYKRRGNKLSELMEVYYTNNEMGNGRRGQFIATIGKIEKFQKGANIEEISTGWLKAFRKSISKELKPTTVVNYMTNIRCAFNMALKKRIITEDPFVDIKIGKARTHIRDLSIEQIRMLRDMELAPKKAVFRDFLMLSFYLCGVNPIDLFYMEKLTDGRFVGTRSKTGVEIDLPVYPEAMEIISKYRGKRRLLYFSEKYKSYKSFYSALREAVKKLGAVDYTVGKLGRRKKVYKPLFGDFPFTAYTMRYSFASIAAELEIPRDYIDVCLAHTFDDMNVHYIRYKRKKVDEAVRKVLDALKGKEGG